KAGSTMTWEQFGVTIADPEQVVLESEPYRRLSYRWHSFTPELAEAIGLGDDARGRIAAEPRSQVSFELEPLGDLVKLTVVHDGFEPGSAVASMVSQGWPRILSDLKTLLETGETLPADPEPSIPARLGLAG
ncbi:MAG TPA: SRPBCC domain-containing protein, partial [Gaiellaceae bacterium]|nr:SRPBCC domain-containing protein [Gaiellaceae bacterium]